MMVTERQNWIFDTLVELADAVSGTLDELNRARLLVTGLAELLAPAEPGVLLADQHGELTIPMAGTDGANAALVMELRLGAGPCRSAHRDGGVARDVDPGDAEHGWPAYAQAIAGNGYATVSAWPLRREDSTLGGVCALSPAGHSIAAAEFETALALTRAAAVGLLHDRALRESRRTTSQLQHALDSRVLIEQAKGVVAVRLGITPSAGFEVLRSYARRHNATMERVARSAILGELSGYDLMADLGAARAGRRGQAAQSG